MPMKEKENLQVGELVCSVAGHDCGDYFLVTDCRDGYVILCDGKRRKATCQKKKNQKHVEGSGYVCLWVREHPERVNNASVRRAIKEWKESNGR